MSVDTINWHAHLGIRKWDSEQTEWVKRETGLLEPQAADFERLNVRPFEISEVDNNLLTTAGLTRIVSLINGAGGTAVTTTTARVGTGNGAGSAAVGDTDLSAVAGSANRWFQTCTVSISTSVLTAVATFASADGNYAWNEWGIDVGTATVTSGNTVAALLLNHKTSIAQGTKASGQTWTATATISSGSTALVAATATTLIEGIASANVPGEWIACEVTFNGVTPTNVPVRIDFCTYTATGTGTTYTPKKTGQAVGTAVSTWKINDTVEPSTPVILFSWFINPTAGVFYQWPLGRELFHSTSVVQGIRLTAPNAVNAIVNLTIEE
jgi:general stress protein CsbA